VTLSQVPIFIICDGAKISKENINKYKSGIVSQDTLNNYELFKDKIKNMYGKDPRFIIEERTERYCFA
jgi:plasmid replication initiation protein